eukprot:m51a1_g6890 hypothetical protein (228) ;mRNA; f:4879-5903
MSTAGASRVQPAGAEEWEGFVGLCAAEEGWEVVAQRADCTVGAGRTSGTDVCRIRVRTAFADVPAATLYDVLHDPEYRSLWDKNALRCEVIEKVDARNAVYYYSAKLPTPLSKRDWVLLCSWRANEEGTEFMIMNKSIPYANMPPQNGYVRANSIRTGYRVTVGPEGKGSIFTYVTHTEWNGWIPTMVVNYATKTYAPSVVDTLHKACVEYPAWKAQHNPGSKPWLD